jgi:4-alpha-glucanotransferase
VPKFQLVLLVHAHQPVGNFDDVLERAYASCYSPFVEVIAKYPSIRIGLHYSGPLLEWIEGHHPEYFDRIRELVSRGQVEMAGGGFYEPILIAIPPEDRQEQLTRLADYVERHFGQRPTGAWLAERVWEPQLPSSLASAGVEYVVVDDNHFLGAGFEIDQLHGHYIAEDLGHSVKMIPSLKTLRYMTPFRPVSENIKFLKETAAKHKNGFAAMGDDIEKFGVWPGTNRLCYQDGWLEDFFSALEQNADWLSVAPPGEAVGSCASLGSANLPTASYTEMMEWSLPTPARNRYHKLLEEFADREDVLPFLRGGTWRGFFSKYAESNLMHKKMLHVSEKVRRLAHLDGARASLEAQNEARTSLLRGQCNDAYWHGIFGGLYAPHLRTAVWSSLVQAETIADRTEQGKREYVAASKLDFDVDGRDEIYFTSDRYSALVSPSDGGTIEALDFRTANVTLINSLQRRVESYHAKLKNLSTAESGVALSIHEQVRGKEEHLERWLHYDRWPRNSCRLLVFGREKTYEDVACVQLEENAALAGGEYRVTDFSDARISLASQDCHWSAGKTLSFYPTPNGFGLICDLHVRRNAAGTVAVNVGLETIVNFLAPSAPDRYFETDGKRLPLNTAAPAAGGQIRVVDEWQKAAVQLDAPGSGYFWISPIETVSESEDGFERIYQGSEIIAVWPIELASGEEWKGQLIFEAQRLK